MSSRPGIPVSSAGGHSLRDVLAAGMATEMDTEMDTGPYMKRARAPCEDNEFELYAVTIAKARVYQPPQEESDNHPYAYGDDKPFVQPQSLPCTPEIEYRRYPEDGQAQLDEVCQKAASDMLTEDGLYRRLWEKVVQKMKNNQPVSMSSSNVQKVANNLFGFEALLCMNNALTRSPDQPPYIDWDETGLREIHDVETRVFGLCIELRNLVEGLMYGQWHHSGEKPDIKTFVNFTAHSCDPRDPPTPQWESAQRS